MPDISSLQRSVERWAKKWESKGFTVESTVFKSGHSQGVEASNVYVLIELTEMGDTVLYEEFKFIANDYAACDDIDLSGAFTEMKEKANARMLKAIKRMESYS